MSKAIRRDVVRKLVEQGKLEAIETYNFDDMLGESRTHHAMPVAMRPERFQDCKEGVCYMDSFDFKTKSGSAYENADGTIHLRVHSNCSFDFRRS